MPAEQTICVAGVAQTWPARQVACVVAPPRHALPDEHGVIVDVVVQTRPGGHVTRGENPPAQYDPTVEQATHAPVVPSELQVGGRKKERGRFKEK